MGKKSRAKARPARPGEASGSPSGERGRLLLLFALLAAALLAVYGGAGGWGFVNLDDPLYLTENAHTQKGLTWENAGWAFTSVEASNWHPVTWLSHLADVTLFGMRPGPMHWENLLLHLLVAALLFLVLRSATGARGPSAAVAFLFALHPLHVESVAWVAERKDLLSALFGLLATAAYLRYVRGPSPGRYLAVVGAFALGLMAKPMVVTLPLVLLLLDRWPLDRTPAADDPHRWAAWGRLLLEKVPLLALSALSSLVTLHAQRAGSSLATLEVLPLGARLANAVVSYARYLGAALVPVDLAVFYPAPEKGWGLLPVAGAALLLAALSAGALALRRTRPYLAVGWLWFLVTLLPVIGLVQVGQQAMADRYTYLPLVGLFVAGVWGAAALCDRYAVPGSWRVAGAVALLLPLGLAARVQTGYWRDSVTLLEHALQVTRPNRMMEMNLAAALSEAGRESEALAYERRTLEREPEDPSLRFNVGVSLTKLGRHEEAVAEYRRALEHPSPPRIEGAIRCNLALSLLSLRRPEEALAQYEAAAPLLPDDVGILVNRGLLLASLRRPNEALDLFARAVALRPDDAAIRYNYGLTLDGLGRLEEAVAQYRKAVEAGGGREISVDAAVALATGLAKAGRLEESLPYFDAALALAPDDVRALANKGRALSLLGRRDEAEPLLRRAASLQPRPPGAPPGAPR